MHLQRNYYEVLGLPTTATADEIKKKYRELARKFHPDLVEDKALGQRIFTQINQAYRALGDAERRSQYDATLNAARTPVKPKMQASIISATTTTTTATANGHKNGAARSESLDKMVHDADMALMDGDAAKARSICETVIKADPEFMQAYSILGDALAHMKKIDEAMKAYRRALHIGPSSIIQAKLSRLQAMRAMQDEAAAEKLVATTNGRGGAISDRTSFIGRLLKRK